MLTNNCTYNFPHIRHQDCERSFHANIRISVVETSSSISSTAVVLAIGVLPLLGFSAASPSATYYIQTVTSCTLWAVLLSITHGLMLAPTLLLLCGENLVMQPRSAPDVLAGLYVSPVMCHRLPVSTVGREFLSPASVLGPSSCTFSLFVHFPPFSSLDFK